MNVNAYAWMVMGVNKTHSIGRSREMGRRRRYEEREARSMKREPNFDLITGNADKIRNCYQRQIHEEARGVENDDG